MFDQIVLLNLRRRPEKLKQTLEELDRAQWPLKQPEVFEAVDGTKIPKPRGWSTGDGAWGCMQSHRHILERAIMHDVRSLLILEDDVTFTERIWNGKEWVYFGRQLQNFLEEVPDDWEGLMIGGQHMEPATPISDGVVRCYNTQRTHCYAVRGQYMKDLYAYWVSTSGHCDHRASEIQKKYKVYAPISFLAGQRDGPSDIDLRYQCNPTRFWSAPPTSKLITWFRVSRGLVEALANRGFHFGYHQSADGRDIGLIDILESGGSRQLQIHRLRTWIDMIQRESSSAGGCQAAMWYPDPIDATLIQEAADSMLLTVHGDSFEQVIADWKRMADEKDNIPS